MKYDWFMRGLLTLSIIFGSLVIPRVGLSAEAGPVPLEVLYPTGVIEVTQLHSARLPDLHDKTICELSNARWEAERTFPVIRQLLQKRFPDAKIIPFTEFIVGKIEIENAENIGEMMRKKGCQAVITGNAA